MGSLGLAELVRDVSTTVGRKSGSIRMTIVELRKQGRPMLDHPEPKNPFEELLQM